MLTGLAACYCFALCQEGWHDDIHVALLLNSGCSMLLRISGVAGTPRCDDFPLWNFPDTDDASRSLARYHTDTLKKMGIVMGPGGLKVLDLHDKKDLLSLYTGEL